jgi:hypothetical protein
MANVSVTVKSPSISGYRPETQLTQGMDFIPNAPVDSVKRIFVMPIGRDTFSYLKQRGVSHFSNYDLAQADPTEFNQLQNIEGRGYDETPLTCTMFGKPNPGAAVWVKRADKPDEFPWNAYPWIWNKLIFPTDENAVEPMSYADGFEAGENYSIDRSIIVFETRENFNATGPQWAFRRAFYEALMPRMAAYWGNKGIQHYVADNYYTNAGKNLLFFGSASVAKQYASKPVSEWDPHELLPGGNLDITNLWCFGVYLGPLDLNVGVALNLIYNGFLAKKANRFLAVFMQGSLEYFPNNFVEIKHPNEPQTGTLYKYVKPPHTSSQAFNYAFISQEHCAGFIPFSMDSKQQRPFTFLREYHQEGTIYYLADGTGPVDNNLYPHWLNNSGEGPEVFPSNGTGDYVWFGKSAWDQTFRRVDGGVGRYCRFQVDNGAWIEASNVDANDVSDAAYEKRGILWTRKQGNLLAFYYLNVFADINLHTVKFEHPDVPNITFVFTVHSSFIWPGLINLSTITV